MRITGDKMWSKQSWVNMIFVGSSSLCRCLRLQNIHYSRSHYHLVNLAAFLLLQITPDIHVCPLHPACTFFLTSLNESAALDWYDFCRQNKQQCLQITPCCLLFHWNSTFFPINSLNCEAFFLASKVLLKLAKLPKLLLFAFLKGSKF